MKMVRASKAARWAALAVTGAMALGSSALLSACGGNAQAQATPPVPSGPSGSLFWELSEAGPGSAIRQPPPGSKPGDILYAQERSDAPAGARGWNVIYVSEIQPGTLKYVSGEIYAPTAPATGQRDVVLWNHPTAGAADSCAPSRTSMTNSPFRVPGMQVLIAQGNVVVASDYVGLGVPGPAYYMAGQPNARASLDMLRVAQKLPEANTSNRFVMYGWSQGGQTTMWAESIAKSYAPEFTGMGAALIAPAVRIRELTLRSMTQTSLAGYVISTLPGIKAYVPELKYGDFLTTEGLEQFPAMADGCFDVWSTASTVQNPYQPNALVPGSPWWNAMTAVDNFSPSGSMPFVIYQGAEDDTTPVNLTLNERQALCSAGSAVEYIQFPGLGHGSVVPEAANAFPAWAMARFKGEAAQSNCVAG